LRAAGYLDKPGDGQEIEPDNEQIFMTLLDNVSRLRIPGHFKIALWEDVACVRRRWEQEVRVTNGCRPAEVRAAPADARIRQRFSSAQEERIWTS
jgi:hypothetical protein